MAYQQPNRARKNLYDFLQTIRETAVDIFWGNHTVDEDDRALLSEVDYTTALNTACAVLAYRQFDMYGTDGELRDSELFMEMRQHPSDSLTTFMSCELALEYGRQLHTIMAQRAIEAAV